MLTPKEVQEKTFSKALFGGYDMAAVDDFLEPLTEDYITLYKENAALKSKLKVLAETVENYRGTEDAMRSVLVNAQKTADQMVADAQAKADEIRSGAEKLASSRSEDIDAEIKARELRLDTIKKSTVDYIEKMRKVYERQLEVLDNLANADEHKDYFQQDADAPESAAEGQDEPSQDEAAQKEEGSPRFEFIDLQMDKDYELK